ncbi:MAG: hypothetical protein H6918_07645 [Sphingomonadaceae bacterium]|nr:hypothetical protein [Sphingomonadaceae bacterium]
MQADPTLRKQPIRKPRRGPADHLREALRELSNGQGELLSHAEKPWASITFSGSRHTLRYAFRGAEAVSAAEDLIDVLPEHEFTIPGQLVADATVTEVAHTLLPSPRMEVTLEVLLLEDA